MQATIMPDLPLTGKSALVTGGARRIGREIALTLARAGADVAITFHNSNFDAAGTTASIAAMGGKSRAIQCDVRSEDSVRLAIRTATQTLGRLDILVNNAAVFASADLATLTLDEWDAVFTTNTRGPFLVSREALPHLRTSHGCIVNIGSLGGQRAWPGHAHYCASKAALHMLTQAMAKSFAPEVRVNCVAPGWIDMADEGKAAPEVSARAARIASRTPLLRNGSAAEVAEAVLYFAAHAPFTTGQILAVDGGLGL
jgi:3-oxoacyl-[acyl-carrier protein] reductase/pteridine reductase